MILIIYTNEIDSFFHFSSKFGSPLDFFSDDNNVTRYTRLNLPSQKSLVPCDQKSPYCVGLEIVI